MDKRIEQFKRALLILKKTKEYKALIDAGFEDDCYIEYKDEDESKYDVVFHEPKHSNGSINFVLPTLQVLPSWLTMSNELSYNVYINIKIKGINNDPNDEWDYNNYDFDEDETASYNIITETNFITRKQIDKGITHDQKISEYRYKHNPYNLDKKSIELRVEEYRKCFRRILRLYKKTHGMDYHILHKVECCDLHKYLNHKWSQEVNEKRFYNKLERYITTKMDPSKLSLFIAHKWRKQKYKKAFLERLKEAA